MNNWEKLSLKAKSELMSIYLKNGITSLDEMKKHYNSLAEGGFASPDHDPNNPYHYHVNGQKVVITPEDWEKYKDDPTFKEIRAAVEAEQAAYPEPEYDEVQNPAWRQAYQSLINGVNLKGRDNISQPLPQGYIRDNKGVPMDAQGNYYMPVETATNAPYFINQERGTMGHIVPVRYEQQQMPDRTIRKLRQPLPVDRVMNVGEERENAINDYVDKYTVSLMSLFGGNEGIIELPDGYIINSWDDIVYKKGPGYRMTKVSNNGKEFLEKYLSNYVGRPVSFEYYKSSYGDDTNQLIFSADELTKLNKLMKKQQDSYTREELKFAERHLQNMFEDKKSFTEEQINIHKNYIEDLKKDLNNNEAYYYDKPKKVSRSTAEKKAIIKVGDLEKVGTFAKGGKLDNPPETFLSVPLGYDNTIYRPTYGTMLPEVKVVAKGDPRKVNNDYYKAHAAERAAFQDKVARRADQGWVPKTMLGLAALPLAAEGAVVAAPYIPQFLNFTVHPVSSIAAANGLKGVAPRGTKVVETVRPVGKKENTFARPFYSNGGLLNIPPYTQFLNTLPDNLKNSGDEYNMRRYWELNNYPKDFNEGIQLGMFTKQDDGYHANSVAFNPVTNSYEFMKDRNHPTYNLELDWYYSDDPEAVEFRKNYKYTPGLGMIPDQYTPIYRDGGPIHIKPENRGKFTALKKRTGHSASWFKENGTPAQKKMAVFELNSKKWKK